MPRQRLFVGVALAALTIVAFAELRHADFVQLDDPAYVSENPRVAEGLTASSVSWAFTTFYNSNWHPLTWLSYLTDVQLFGVTPGAHHVVNLAFHVVNTLLLFVVLTTLTGSTWRSAFASALFAVHPLHVESVAWISERKDVLSTFFWLLTLLAYVGYVRDPAPRRYALVLGCFVLGLMAKPMLVTLPFVLLLIDYWPLRRSALREKVPLFVLAAVSSVITVIAQQRGGAVMSLDVIPIGQRITNALVSYVTYLWKALWPVDLAAFYPYRPAEWSAVAVAVVALAAITVVVLRMARRTPAPLVGWLWYLGTLVPVIGLVQVGRQAMADRYTYVPLIGIFIAVAWAVPALAPRARVARVATGLAALGILIACTVVTRAQVEHWRTNQAMWSRALAVTLDVDPALARVATTALAKDERRVSETIARFFQADPARARADLALLLLPAGRQDEAIAMLRDALRVDPSLASAHSNLGRLLGQRGQYPQAVEALSEAVRLMPRDAAARTDLGLALAYVGRLDDARAQYNEALAIDPKMPELHNNIGLLLAAQKRVADAFPHFAEAVRLRPDYVEALRNLGIAHLQLDRPAEAAQVFQKVLELSPNDETARKGLEVIRSR